MNWFLRPDKDAANGSSDILAFIFERKDERFVVYWHTTGSGSLELELNASVTLEKSWAMNR